jgi:hypothetical protein
MPRWLVLLRATLFLAFVDQLAGLRFAFAVSVVDDIKTGGERRCTKW